MSGIGNIGNLFGGGGVSNAAGGISGPQAALGMLTGSSSELANAAKFGSSKMGGGGIGQSTMSTYADAGSLMSQVLADQQMSAADTSALTNYNNQQKAQASQNIGSLGGLLGSSSGGGFSNTGSFG
jgi:hypothetical protein